MAMNPINDAIIEYLKINIEKCKMDSSLTNTLRD